MIIAEHWISLIGNLSVVALVISAWVHGQFVFAGRRRVERNFAFGIAMGVGAAASMLLSIQIDGALFDLRSSLISIAAFFGGPVAATAAALVAIAHRIFVVGGASAMVGVVGIVTAGLVGLAVARVARDWSRTAFAAALLALSVASTSAIVSLLVRVTVNSHGVPLSLTVAAMNAVATAIACFYIMRHDAIERERDLLRAAFRQSPDFQYVKTRDGRFAAANTTMLQHHHLASVADIIGKTNFDLIDDAGRASALAEDDRRVIETGVAIVDTEEHVVGRNGEDIWYLTSKVPLFNGDGEVVGLAGVTRDVTARKQLQQEITDSRNQLNYVLSEMSDGIARFDGNGILIYCNERYRELFPLTADVRRPGASLRTILEAIVRTGEQTDIPAGREQDWIDRTVSSLGETGEQEIAVTGEHWLLVRTRPTSDGSSLVVVSDVTRIKRAESALLSLTEQLKLLASTDGLTGLTNRRAFDQALENELTRSRRSNLPLALLMIDVDRFKAYNDLYGHPAGDGVLQAVGNALAQSVRRPGDVAARYGGEEFAAVLPATDEDGAYHLAESFRARLHELAIPHSGNHRKIVTVSIGIAVFAERDAGLNATELVRRADAALYNAKGAGRDRVAGWRQHDEDRPVSLKR